MFSLSFGFCFGEGLKKARQQPTKQNMQFCFVKQQNIHWNLFS